MKKRCVVYIFGYYCWVMFCNFHFTSLFLESICSACFNLIDNLAICNYWGVGLVPLIVYGGYLQPCHIHLKHYRVSWRLQNYNFRWSVPITVLSHAEAPEGRCNLHMSHHAFSHKPSKRLFSLISVSDCAQTWHPVGASCISFTWVGQTFPVKSFSSRQASVSNETYLWGPGRLW